MSRNDDMTIRFSGLKSGYYVYDFTLDDNFFEEQKNEEITGGTVKVEARMEKKEHLLMFNFKLKGEIKTWCDRCLGEMTVPIEGEETLCVRFSDTEVCDDDDVEILPESAFEIDLTHWLYEYVAVRLPLQHIHREGECDPDTVRFISTEDETESKTEGDVDPRWESLRAILNGEGDNGNEINK